LWYSFRWHLLGLAILAFILTIGVFLRGDLFGFDAYASWECVKGNCEYLGIQPLAIMLFKVFPNHLLFFKFVMFASAFASVTALWFIARRFFDERVSWISVIGVAALSPLVVFLFGQFENELFALPLLFWSFYFVLSEKYWVKFLSFPLLAVALFFWGGTAYFLFVLAPIFFWTIVPFLLVVYFEWNALILPFRSSEVMESRLFSAFFDLFGLILVVPFIFRCKNWWIWFSFGVALIFVAIQGKFVAFLLPFFIIGLGNAWLILEKRGFSAFNVLLVCFFLIIGWNVAIFMQQPTSIEWGKISEVIQLQKDTNYPLYNDWSFGYWLIHKGYDTNFKGGFPNPDYNQLQKPFVALTQEELPCKKVSEYTNYFRSIKLFECGN